MPTETKLPDGLLENSGFASIALADIDEDPDSPDANWANASTNLTDPIARVSFPTPTGPPTGVQTFKMYVRKGPPGSAGTGTPTARLDLYENGGLLASGADQNVTSTTGQMLSQNFDLGTTPLGTSDGSLVELRFVVTHAAGSPAVRCSVDLGALNWDTVNYSTGTTYTKAGFLLASGVASGADAPEHAELGSLLASMVFAGGDVSEFAETGLVLAGSVLSGPSEKLGAALGWHGRGVV